MDALWFTGFACGSFEQHPHGMTPAAHMADVHGQGDCDHTSSTHMIVITQAAHRLATIIT
jgi:hypothetical protein